MMWLESLLDNATTPIVTAFVLGLLSAVSPCTLATNIAAMGYIGKQSGESNRAFWSGLLYALGRVLSYGALGVILIGLVHAGDGVFHLQRLLSVIGERVLGPLLLVMGVLMLVGDRLPLRGFGLKGDGKGFSVGLWGSLLLGMLLALAFCPTSAMFYFGILIPLSCSSDMGYFFPIVFAIATSFPVLLVAWIVAYSVNSLSRFYKITSVVQKWMNYVVSVLFMGIGLYYCFILLV